MKILISNISDVPIYRQIAEAVKEEILSGGMGEGDALPSIRSLAGELSVSVITAKKAYEELEAAGYINAMQGKGFFVSPRSRELAREHRRSLIEQHILSAADAAKAAGMSKEEFAQTARDLWDL